MSLLVECFETITMSHANYLVMCDLGSLTLWALVSSSVKWGRQSYQPNECRGANEKPRKTVLET